MNAVTADRRCRHDGCDQDPAPGRDTCASHLVEAAATSRPRGRAGDPGDVVDLAVRRWHRAVLALDPTCTVCDVAPSTRAQLWPWTVDELDSCDDPHSTSFARGVCDDCHHRTPAADRRNAPGGGGVEIPGRFEGLHRPGGEALARSTGVTPLGGPRDGCREGSS